MVHYSRTRFVARVPSTANSLAINRLRFHHQLATRPVPVQRTSTVTTSRQACAICVLRHTRTRQAARLHAEFCMQAFSGNAMEARLQSCARWGRGVRLAFPAYGEPFEQVSQLSVESATGLPIQLRVRLQRCNSRILRRDSVWRGL